MPTAITLTLMNGSPALLQVVEVIGTNIPSSAGKYEWAIPTNLSPGKYAIRASGSPEPSYSPFFSVVLSGGSKADLPRAISPNPKPPASSPLQPVTRKLGTDGKSKARG
ncbi:hypothetical protein K7432_009510 [Basidiobolus ranarum]|uniref:Yeast cell wall synthesis Kre9/Knh1-like N-terminal domain-containing protein n=1 Tax=Basidiobolus ranarum TaxID=34480 RepID=A0ABR2WQ39_9FUNG